MHAVSCLRRLYERKKQSASHAKFETILRAPFGRNENTLSRKGVKDVFRIARGGALYDSAKAKLRRHAYSLKKQKPKKDRGTLLFQDGI